jgi:hypothetical protein
MTEAQRRNDHCERCRHPHLVSPGMKAAAEDVQGASKPRTGEFADTRVGEDAHARVPAFGKMAPSGALDLRPIQVLREGLRGARFLSQITI